MRSMTFSKDHGPMTQRGAKLAPEGLASSASASQHPLPETLPSWDLSDLYPAIDSPALQADLDAAAARPGISPPFTPARSTANPPPAWRPPSPSIRRSRSCSAG